MKKFYCIILWIHCLLFGWAQKQSLGYNTYRNWPTLDKESICNDGHYVLYTVESEIAGTKLVIQATDNSWKVQIWGVTSGVFTEDSKRVIYMASQDSIGILDLANGLREFIPNAKDFTTTSFGSDEWLIYRSVRDQRTLILQNILTKEKIEVDSVSDYKMSKKKGALVVLKEHQKDSVLSFSLDWINLSKGEQTLIWTGRSAGNIEWDEDGRQLAFVAQSTSFQSGKFSLWYYRVGMDRAIKKVDELTPGMEGMSVCKNQTDFNFVMGSLPLPYFSRDGKKLFFSIEKNDIPKSRLPDIGRAQVDIWNYKDEFLQSQQLSHLEQKKMLLNKDDPGLTAVLYLDDDKKIERLQTDRDNAVLQVADEGNGKYILVKSNAKGDMYRNFWQLSTYPDIYLVSTEDGTRNLIRNQVRNEDAFTFSPTGKYVIWYDNQRKQYYTYNTIGKDVHVISCKIPFAVSNNDYVDPSFPAPYGIATWMDNDSAVLIYDQFDIWQVDPNGAKSPINLTKSYGRKRNITFRFLDLNNANQIPTRLKPGGSILLLAFERKYKQNGFFKLQLTPKNNPVQLTMGPFAYYTGRSNLGLASASRELIPLKAKNAETYLVSRMNSTNFPNLYITHDFRKMTQITQFTPEKEFNWYTTELVSWKKLNGQVIEGIIYKPEDFDSTKKYPVIFYYYEHLSDNLNEYINPGLSLGSMNIPFFVSRGYVVFVPDISYKIAHTGESSNSSVSSAAQYLVKKPWVGKMGLQGYSFGGYETDFILTRTHIFSAAFAGAAPTDFISSTYSLRLDGESEMYMSEGGQMRMGSDLWENREAYIKNSPIFYADKVTTPLLIMHNKLDGNVNWSQGIEWYLALLRLGKKVWMLQYDGENHGLFDKTNQLDFSIRLTQFFDHYLKDAPPPVWMTKGVPAADKQIISGLELDTSGALP